MADLWDLVDTKNKNNELLCPKLFAGNAEPFVRSFVNDVYVVLSLKAKHFIEIIPPHHYQM